MKLWLFALLLFVPSAMAVTNLSANETYQFNYTNLSNNTVTELFYCAAHNESMCALRNLSLSIAPGETVSLQNGSCSLTASCAGIPSNATCVVSRTMAPGERYQNVGGACNIDITAGNSTVITTTTPTVPYRGAIQVTNTGGILTITVDNQSFVVDASRNGVLYKQDVEVVCPVQPTFQPTVEDADYLVKQCKSWVPMLDKTISSLVDATQICGDSATQHVNDIKASSDRERSQIAQIGTYQAQLAEANKDRDAAIAAKNDLDTQLALQTGRAETNKMLAFILAAFMLIFAGILAWFVLSMNTRNRGRA
jgi:hypothetical protein